jgi:hypothetical protein
MFYAASTLGFYSREIHGDKIPSDAVEITRDMYLELLDGQSKGKIISIGVSGLPLLVDPAPQVLQDDALKARVETLEAKP